MGQEEAISWLTKLKTSCHSPIQGEIKNRNDIPVTVNVNTCDIKSKTEFKMNLFKPSIISFLIVVLYLFYGKIDFPEKKTFPRLSPK